MALIELIFIDFASDVSDEVKLSRYKQLSEIALINAEKGLLTALQPVIEKECQIDVKVAPALFYQRLLNDPDFIEHITSLGYQWKDLWGVAEYWSSMARQARNTAFESAQQRRIDESVAKDASKGFIH